jgi:hypothetical protein
MTALLLSGCKMIWRPQIDDEFAVRETRNRYKLIAAGMFDGIPAGDEGFRMPIGFVGTGIRAATYPPGGEGTAFLLDLPSRDGRNVKPGMYKVNTEEDRYRPGSFSNAEFYTEYNMDDFEPRIGSVFYSCTGGTINVYSFSETEIHLTWAIDIVEYIDTGSGPLPTGLKSVADGAYKGTYSFYNVPVATEHKGYGIEGEFHPLATAAAFLGKESADGFSIPVIIGGPESVTSEWPMSGRDSFVMFNLISDEPDSVKNGHYDFAESRPDVGKLYGFTTSTETDFSDFKPKDGSRVFVPIGGFCKVGTFKEGFLEMQWSVNAEEYIYHGELVPTGSSHMVGGAYSGELVIFDFNLPADWQQ